MHPQSHPTLRYVLLVLLITALIVLFPLSARSVHETAALPATLAIS